MHRQVGSLPAVESLREEPMVREELWREMQRLFSGRRWTKSAIARELGLDVGDQVRLSGPAGGRLEAIDGRIPAHDR